MKKPDAEQVLAAEAAAQRSVCDFPEGDIPDDLKAALERRVEFNLKTATDATVRRIGSTDPEVQRLEAPYSKRVAIATSSDTSRAPEKRPAVLVKPKKSPKE